jgi:hypothetical protein
MILNFASPRFSATESQKPPPIKVAIFALLAAKRTFKTRFSQCNALLTF